MLAILAPVSSAVFAQETGNPDHTRAGLLAAERDQKSSETAPPERSLVERGLYWYDNQYLLARISAGWNGLRLAGGDFPAGAGTTYGVGFTRALGSASHPERSNRIDLDTVAARSTRGYTRASAALGIQRIAGTSLGARARAQRYAFPQEDFFGLGADSRQDDRTNYLHDSSEAGVELHWKPLRRVELSGGVFFVRPAVESGTDSRFPSTEQIYVQTDASINPGSSGGALVDLHGRLVGINTMIVSRTGGNESLGFAAPSNIVRTVYEQIRTFGRVRRGDIGIRAQTVTSELAAGLSLPEEYPVILGDVIPGSPADVAGLRTGDLVIALDGKRMENGRQLQVNLYRRLIGDAVSFDVLRSGRRLKIVVAMTERHDPFAGLSESSDPRQNLVPRLGVLAVNLDRRLAAMLGVLRVRAGVVVASTMAGGVDAREGGLTAGDVVFAVNGQPVTSLAELRAALDAFEEGDAIVLQLERRGELMYLAFALE